ncbi:MAG TPA: hypothetical protein VMF90_09285 [Rhizobiaceae bacterium]|nr:hypothetical protein [Rhizobiaceae bacterium]
MRLVSIATALVMLPTVAAAAMLDITGKYGNEAGCRYAATNDYTDDTLLLISPDEYMTYVTLCEFLQALPVKDGSKVMTMLCAHEGETMQTIDFMRIQKSPDVGDSYDLFNAEGDHLGIVGRCK